MTTNPDSEAGKLRRIEHDPDGVTTEFEVPFAWINDSDVIVYLIADDANETPDEWEQNVDYTLTSNVTPPDDTGGTLTATVAPVGKKLLIWAETPRNQGVKYEDGGDFPADAHEGALDKNAYVDAEDARDLGRALRAPDTDIDQLNVIPPRTDRANQALLFDGAGQPTAGGISQKGDLLTSEYGEGLVLTANATAARSYLAAAGAADVTTLNAKIDAIARPGDLRPRLDESDLTPTFIPLDGRTIGKESSGADVANDGLRALFDIAKAVPGTGNSGSEDFDAGDTVRLPDTRGRTLINTGQGVGLTLRNLGDSLGTEANDTIDGATGTGGNVASTTADSNMQPSYAVPLEVYSGVLPSLEQINLGQLGITWDPSGWAAGTPYLRNAALRNGSGTEGRSYIALQDHTSTVDDEPGVGANWETYWAIMNYDGSPGGVANWRGAWSAITPYVQNDGVQHNGSSWIANANSTGSEPGVGAEWDLQAAKGDPGIPGEVSIRQAQDSTLVYLTSVAGTPNRVTAQANPTLPALVAGQKFHLKLTGSNTGPVTLTIDSTAETPVKTPTGLDIPAQGWFGARVVTVVYDGTNFVDDLAEVAALVAAPAQTGNLITNNSGLPLVALDMSAGRARDSADAEWLVLPVAMSKRLDQSWVAGDGNGGLASNLVLSANATYHGFLIRVGGVVDVGYDTDPNAANLIAQHGVTAYRHRGARRTDGTAQLLALNSVTETAGGGERVILAASIQDRNSGASGLTNITLSVPIGIEVRPIIDAEITGGASFAELNLGDRSTGQAAPRRKSLFAPGGNSRDRGEFHGSFITDTQGRIQWEFLGSVVAATVDTYGWIDERRR